MSQTHAWANQKKHKGTLLSFQEIQSGPQHTPLDLQWAKFFSIFKEHKFKTNPDSKDHDHWHWDPPELEEMESYHPYVLSKV